jgi:type I restriction enzyme M protein
VATRSAKKGTKSIEETLFDAASDLRGSVDVSEYKHVVLGLIFLKFASDKFEQRRSELIAEDKSKWLETVEFYTMKNVFYLPEQARWQHLVDNAKQSNIAQLIDDALARVERDNESLRGALPQNYYSSLNLNRSKLSALIAKISSIDTLADKNEDLIGRVYEYFLRSFAILEGNGKGEFYTPKNVVSLMTDLIEPYSGKIYDPCCGSGGMFVQSLRFVEAHQGNAKEIAVYGQEATSTTYKLARMNLAIRGIPADLGESAEDTFHRDLHPDLKADFILANPPFNQKGWRDSDQLIKDPRWSGFQVPPESNANYAWILHMISKLSQNGTAAFLLANGALSDPDSTASQIRRQLIENDLVEAIIVLPRDMFYSTDISVTMWIVSRNKGKRTVKHPTEQVTLRDRSGEVLFMDLRREAAKEGKFATLNEEALTKAVGRFRSWQRQGEGSKINETEYAYVANKAEIQSKNFNLRPSEYIAFDQKVGTPSPNEVISGIVSDMTEVLASDASVMETLKRANNFLGTQSKLIASNAGKVFELGDFIELCDETNVGLGVEMVRGISTTKLFIPTKADMSKVDIVDYHLVRNKDFSFNPNTARMGDRIPIALNFEEEILVSKIYPVFRVRDQNRLIPEYLYLWFRRPDFDRFARFHSWGSARETFGWEDMKSVKLPIPSLEVQQAIVELFSAIQRRNNLSNDIQTIDRELSTLMSSLY